jgi:hypothetical protein
MPKGHLEHSRRGSAYLAAREAAKRKIARFAIPFRLRIVKPFVASPLCLLIGLIGLYVNDLQFERRFLWIFRFKMGIVMRINF